MMYSNERFIANIPLLMIVLFAATLTPVRAFAASVSEARGVAHVKMPDSEWFPCTKDLDVKERMSLRTGRNGRITIRYGNGSLIIIRPQTQVFFEKKPGDILSREDAVHMVLEDGAVIVKNEREGKKYEFRISTPSAAVTAEKSIFAVIYNKDKGTLAGAARGQACAVARSKKVCVDTLQSTRIPSKKSPSMAMPAAPELLALWNEEDLLPTQSQGDLMLRVNKPENGQVVNRSPLTVAGSTRPGATMTVNGKSVTVQPGGGFSAEVGLSEGENTITVEARFGGDRASVAVKAILDTTPPLLTVSQPMDGFDPSLFGTCDRRNCYIQVFGITEPGVKLTVNRLDVSQYVEDDGSFFITDFPLDNTETVLRVEATDKSGQRSVHRLTVSAPLDSDGDLRPDHLDACPMDPSCQ